MMKTGNLFLALVVGLACGLLFGAINGALITAFDIPAVHRNAGIHADGRRSNHSVHGGQNYSNLPASFNFLGQGVHQGSSVPGGDRDPRADHHVHHTGMDPDGEVVICDRRKPGGSTGVGYPCKEIKFFACAFGGVCTGACRNPADGADEFRAASSR